MSVDDNSKSVFESLLLLGIFVTFVFILFVGNIGLKINNNDFCGTDKFGLENNKEVLLSGYVLDSSVDVVSQSFSVDNPDENVGFLFCYNIFVLGDYASLNVVSDNVSLSTFFVGNNTVKDCVRLDESLVSDDSFIGLSCNNCNGSNTVTLYKEVTGARSNIVFDNDGSVSVTNDNSLDWFLIGEKSCKVQLKFYTKLFYILLGMLIFGFLLFVGYDKMKEFVMSGGGVE